MPIVKTPNQLGAVVRTARTVMRLPAADFAAMTGISRVLLRKLEQGNATTALKKLFTVLDELGIQMHLEPPSRVGPIELPINKEKPKRTRVTP